MKPPRYATKLVQMWRVNSNDKYGVDWLFNLEFVNWRGRKK